MKARGRLACAVILLFPLAAAAQESLGARAFQYCISCHSVMPEETGLPAPNLFGVVGRPVASQTGFAYSDAMKAFAAKNPVWTEDLLRRFIQDPQAVVPGTEMQPVPGLPKTGVMPELLAYLRAHH